MQANRYFGDRRFYRLALSVALPIMIQNGITNLVGMLDNIMVGRVGTVEMTGVSIANTLLFVFNLAVFGAVSGAGIFGAQFHGKGDVEGVRAAFRFKLLECAVLLALGCGVFLLFGEKLLMLYLRGEGEQTHILESLACGNSYLRIMLLGLPGFILAQCYAGTLRETGKTLPPMAAGLAAVGVNFVCNWLLIFGKLGLPRLEVVGAALATVLSRYIELAIVAIYTHRHHSRFAFIEGAYRSMRVPGALLRKVLRMGAPLLANEVLWSIGMSTLTAVYSMCGLTVVSALSITFTISNLFSSVYMSLGTAVSVMIGQALGAGDFERAKADVWRLITFGVVGAAGMGLLLILFAPLIPRAYTGVTQDVRQVATSLLIITACAMPLYSFSHCSYFTLRSGGKTIITFLFDSGYTWAISVPLALLMVKGLHADVLLTYAVVEMANIIKCLLGYAFVKSGKWIQNLTRIAGNA